MHIKRNLVSFIGMALIFTALPIQAGKLDGFREEEMPSGEMMVADTLVGRPLGLASTLAGSGLFFLSLPFSALGGNIDEAAERLVAEPARETFERCLGCKVGERRERSSNGNQETR